MRGATAIILEYGKRPPARWRRLLRWAIVAVLLVTLAFAGLFALRNLSIWIARRHGYAAVAAWYEHARTFVVPAGTLLYSERSEDINGPRSINLRGTETFESSFPLLRQIAYDKHGVPQTIEFGVLYVHEHDCWDVPAGKRPSLICVRYNGLDRLGLPQFSTMSYRLAPVGSKVRIPSMGGTTTVRDDPGRPLTNLRIFAGAPHPTDATRFSLPFDCDGGHGRFEFQTDTDVTDGGKLAPDVRIQWDDAPTQPGAADAVQR